MKITISHDQASIDPSGIYSDADFATVKAALEDLYRKALLDEYPSAEIDFSGTDSTYAVKVEELADNYAQNYIHEAFVNVTLSEVFEDGAFWL
tara:strand:- start:22610 stop:22888 length:279 start_codon:yes stop_codon:yes gene_type:complete